jgi:hypothetical protein
MRTVSILALVFVSACTVQPDNAPSQPSAVDAAAAAVEAAKKGGEPPAQTVPAENTDGWVTGCMTEETLREANASKEDIEQFRAEEAKAKAEAKADAEATCG